MLFDNGGTRLMITDALQRPSHASTRYEDWKEKTAEDGWLGRGAVQRRRQRQRPGGAGRPATISGAASKNPTWKIRCATVSTGRRKACRAVIIGPLPSLPHSDVTHIFELPEVFRDASLLPLNYQLEATKHRLAPIPSKT